VSVHETLPPGCEPACHACRHRRLDAAASAAQKQGYLARALAPWVDRVAPVVPAPAAARLGYRDRVTLTVRGSAGEGWRFGLMRRDEHVPIHGCPVHTRRVRGLVALLAGRLPYLPDWPLAYLHVSGAQAVLVVKARTTSPEVLGEVTPALAALGIEGLWLHHHPSAGRKLFARSGWELAWGAPRSRDAGGLWHGPTAFMQAMPSLHGRSLAEAAGHLEPGPATPVLDLCCGIGASLRAWRTAGSPALGVELSGEAVELAARNAPGATVLRGTCVDRLPQVRDWWRSVDGVRVAYVNPPRSGLEAPVLAALADELRPRRIGYLSCSAGTLARDLAVLESAGYDVERIVPYDFFPFTHHVETLALASLRT
jgi:tRNA/tmRNA/rRNA uracil-C5-methylase (TrmA/RlmC/RlmD family)